MRERSHIDSSFLGDYNVVTMRAKIVPLGNSQGVRIPKLLLEQALLPDEIELEVVGNTIVIRPARKPREGWVEDILAKGTEPLSAEDLEWLDAPLSEQADKDWE